ncbi:hypothetical protein MASR2M64_08590 [Candidatus Cloacimonadota bacterium]|nr:hypothetical protein [Candidatus Cloacimonadota bacterium]
MMKIVNIFMAYLEAHSNLKFFLRYTLLFTMLLLSLAFMALNRIVSTEANPFFYANF